MPERRSAAGSTPLQDPPRALSTKTSRPKPRRRPARVDSTPTNVKSTSGDFWSPESVRRSSAAQRARGEKSSKSHLQRKVKTDPLAVHDDAPAGPGADRRARPSAAPLTSARGCAIVWPAAHAARSKPAPERCLQLRKYTVTCASICAPARTRPVAQLRAPPTIAARSAGDLPRHASGAAAAEGSTRAPRGAERRQLARSAASSFASGSRSSTAPERTGPRPPPPPKGLVSASPTRSQRRAGGRTPTRRANAVSTRRTIAPSLRAQASPATQPTARTAPARAGHVRSRAREPCPSRHSARAAREPRPCPSL
jgi:hypothetical protein